MSCLAPCPTCNRHVATDETTCPFCSAALPDSFRCQPPRQRLSGRLSRAGLLAAGAALLGGGAACLGATHYGGSMPIDAGTDTGTMDGGAAPANLEETPTDDTSAHPSPAPSKT